MALHIPDIRAIRLFVIPYADFMPSALLATLTVTNGRMTRILSNYSGT